MKCDKVIPLFIDLIEGIIKSEDKETVLAHIAKCTSCRQEYESLNEMVSIIRESAKFRREQINVPFNTEDRLRKSLEGEGKMLNRHRPIFVTGAVAGVAVLLFLFIINVSPVMSYYLNQIPVVDQIVRLGLIDKGLVKAVEGSKGQLIEKSSISNNIKFTVHEIIAGENRTAIFYSMEGFPSINAVPEINSIFMENGIEQIQRTVGASSFDKENQRITGVFEFKPLSRLFSNVEVIIPEVIVDNKIIKGPWEVSFYVDKKKARGKRFDFTVNKEVKFNEEKIKIIDVSVTPIDTIISFETSNTSFGESEKSVGADDSLKSKNKLTKGIVVIDQKGNEYTPVQKNVSQGKGYWIFSLTYPDKPSRIIIGDTQQTIFLQ